jgi:hypothetical protein
MGWHGMGDRLSQEVQGLCAVRGKKLKTISFLAKTTLKPTAWRTLRFGKNLSVRACLSVESEQYTLCTSETLCGESLLLRGSHACFIKTITRVFGVQPLSRVAVELSRVGNSAEY